MRIAMPRGDIRWQRFIICTPFGEPADIEFTNIYFTVKKDTTEEDYIFQKSLKRGEITKVGQGDYQLKIDSKDTEDMLFGDYVFDVQVSYYDLLKETFVGDFTVLPEVTFYHNEEAEETEQDPNIIIKVSTREILRLKTSLEITTSEEP